jgi:hypothetical protein
MRPFILEVSQSINIDLLRVNPARVYVFEDTLDRSGSFGQALVREESNACGIPVRKSPGLTCKALFSDQDHEFEAVPRRCVSCTGKAVTEPWCFRMSA